MSLFSDARWAEVPTRSARRRVARARRRVLRAERAFVRVRREVAVRVAVGRLMEGEVNV